MNNNNSTRVFVWLEIYQDCPMAATLNYDDELRFSLGDPFNEDRAIVFERRALERFVQLASDALKLELPEDGASDPPELVSAF